MRKTTSTSPQHQLIKNKPINTEVSQHEITFKDHQSTHQVTTNNAMTANPTNQDNPTKKDQPEATKRNNKPNLLPDDALAAIKHHVINLIRTKPKGYELETEQMIQQLKDVNTFEKYRDCHYNLLFHASLEDCPEATKYLLEYGADPTLTNLQGTNVLHMMAKRGQTEMAQMCYAKITEDKKTDFVNKATNSGWTPLMSAAENDKPEFIKWLISKNADINAMMNTGWTALHAAVKKDNHKVAELLLKAGADKTITANHKDLGNNKTAEDNSRCDIMTMILETTC